MSGPICSMCSDTRRMPHTGYMCTHCPVPCEACRSRGPGHAGGAYCAITPCPCSCHAKRQDVSVPDYADDQDAAAEPSPREHAMYLRTWLRSHWGEFPMAFETALCNAIAALEATEP